MRKSIVLLAMTTWLSLESEGCDALAATPQESSPPVTARAAARTGQLSPDGAPPVFNVTDGQGGCAASHGASLPIAFAVLAVVLRRRRDPGSGEAGH